MEVAEDGQLFRRGRKNKPVNARSGDQDAIDGELKSNEEPDGDVMFFHKDLPEDEVENDADDADDDGPENGPVNERVVAFGWNIGAGPDEADQFTVGTRRGHKTDDDGDDEADEA